MPAAQPAGTGAAQLRVHAEGAATRIALAGRLEIETVAGVWKQALAALARAPDLPAVVDASQVEYADGAGIALLLDLLRQPRGDSARVRIEGLAPRYQTLLAQLDPTHFHARPTRPRPVRPLALRIGERGADLARHLADALAFIGEAAAELAHALVRPRTLRWKDAILAAQRVGVDALPIVSLVAFLIGVILAFQAAVAMRPYGAEIFVANLVGISLLRELSPLMTAILLAGRSGAAFAAEIGTMRVNEEVDALVTMGLDPVRFLVVPRTLAALVMTPLLTLYADLIGLFGGAAVMGTFEIPWAAYMHQTFAYVELTDFLGGMAKSFVFGLIVAAVGCLRGLQTRTGAAAVGLSATSAVVTAIVLIVVADGIFAVLYYRLDI